jgi:hypothetical protein
MSKLSDAAYEWLKKTSAGRPVSTKQLWEGLREEYPELTVVTESRKTPRTTLMRDIRLDRRKRFISTKGFVGLASPEC